MTDGGFHTNLGDLVEHLSWNRQFEVNCKWKTWRWTLGHQENVANLCHWNNIDWKRILIWVKDTGMRGSNMKGMNGKRHPGTPLSPYGLCSDIQRCYWFVDKPMTRYYPMSAPERRIWDILIILLRPGQPPLYSFKEPSVETGAVWESSSRRAARSWIWPGNSFHHRKKKASSFVWRAFG